MGEPRSLSPAELMHAAGEQDKHIRVLRWHNCSISIKKLLTMEEYVDTVMSIINSCQRDDGSVSIELLDFSFRVNIVNAYAYVSLPEELEDLYYLMYSSDLYDFICENVNSAQLNAIRRSAERMIYSECGDV